MKWFVIIGRFGLCLSNPAFNPQIWICSIWLFQENRHPWTQTLALYWDIFGVQKGKTHFTDWCGDLRRHYVDDCFDYCDSSSSLFLRASTILTRNAFRNMEECGGKCLIVMEKEYITSYVSHAKFHAESLQYLLMHHKVVRWQAASPGCNGHSYDQNDLG